MVLYTLDGEMIVGWWTVDHDEEHYDVVYLMGALCFWMHKTREHLIVGFSS